jgi:hypothetical protein
MVVRGGKRKTSVGNVCVGKKKNGRRPRERSSQGARANGAETKQNLPLVPGPSLNTDNPRKPNGLRVVAGF